MGVYNHVAILFKKNFFTEIGLSEMDSYIYYRINGHNSSPKGIGCLMNISGSNLCYFDTGGDFAIELDLKFAKFLILKPFPGSEVYYQLDAKGLIDSREYSKYGVYTAPVHHLDTLSQERIFQNLRFQTTKTKTAPA